MRFEDLVTQRHLFSAFAEADVKHSLYRASGDTRYLADARGALCEAGTLLLKDEEFWVALIKGVEESDTVALLEELLDNKERFLDLERSVLSDPAIRPNLPVPQANQLLEQLRETILKLDKTYRGSEISEYHVHLLRELISEATDVLCGMENLDRPEPEPSLVQRAVGWIRRHKRQVGAGGLIVANGLAGVGALALPPVAAFFPPSSVVMAVLYGLESAPTTRLG